MGLLPFRELDDAFQLTKRIRMSGAVQQAACAKPRVDYAWVAVFVAIDGHWATLNGELIWINDSIGECWYSFKLRAFYLELLG